MDRLIDARCTIGGAPQGYPRRGGALVVAHGNGCGASAIVKAHTLRLAGQVGRAWTRAAVPTAVSALAAANRGIYFPRPVPPQLVRLRRRLLGHIHHVIDSRLHQVIWDVGATTFRRHYTRASLEALERVVIENFLALGNAGSPRSLVAGLRGTGNPGSMACTAHLLEGLVTRFRKGRTTRAACLTSSRIGLDGKSGVVLASDGFLGDRPQVGFDTLEVLALLQYLLVLGLAGNDPRQRKNTDGNYDQQTDDHAEGVKEVGILLAHVWIRVERL